MRESYSVETHKTIYERTSYPTNGGNFEKAFIEFLDRDGDVERFIKIQENAHLFATIFYMRTDGLMATYHPDFIAETGDMIYLIETSESGWHLPAIQMLNTGMLTHTMHPPQQPKCFHERIILLITCIVLANLYSEKLRFLVALSAHCIMQESTEKNLVRRKSSSI